MDPGFHEEVLHFLEKRAEKVDEAVLCNLVLDEVSIRQQLILKNNKRYGCVDLGIQEPRNETRDDEGEFLEENEDNNSDDRSLLPPGEEGSSFYGCCAQ